MKLTMKEVELLNTMAEGYARYTEKEADHALTYYQDEKYKELKEEMTDVYILLNKIYANIEIEEK